MIMYHRLSGMLLLVMAVALPLPVTAATSSTNLTGTVYVFDSAAHTVTLKDSGGALTTLTVNSKSKITRNGKKVTLGGLVLGDQGSAVADTSNVLIQLTVKGPVVTAVQGRMEDLTSGTGTVHVRSGKKLKSTETSGHTRVMRNGHVSSLNALTSFDNIIAHMSKNSHHALDIQAEGPEDMEIKGTVTAVTAATDALPASVTLTPLVGSPVTLSITPNTIINVGGATGTVGDLTLGMLVEAAFDPVSLDAFHIEAEDEEDDAGIEGTITALDTTSCTLSASTPCTVTITGAGGSVTLIVNASTKIKLNDVAVLLSDLQIGDPAEAEFNSTSLVAHEIEVEVEDESGDNHGGNGGGEKD